MASLSVDEKKRFLKALEEDEEFRYAVAGKLGLSEILQELKRIHEDIRKLWLKSLEHDKRFEEMVKRFEAIEKKLLEHDKRFEEMNKRFEVIEKKLLEHDKRFEEINKRFEVLERKLLEHDKRFEVIERKLLEHDKRFEVIERKLLEHDKRFEAIERKLLEHDKRFEAIERKLLEHDKRFEFIEKELKSHRRLIEHNRRDIAALTEATISRYVYEDLREMIRELGERILVRKRNARVDNIDVDLLVETDKAVYVVEVKIQPNHHDVNSLLKKAEYVAKKYGKQVKPVLATVWIGREVEEYAENKGVQVMTY